MISATPLKLEACDWCAGTGSEPTAFGTVEPCGCCGGGRYKPLFFDLGPTRTYKTRPCCWNHGRSELTLTRGKKLRTTYTVTEFRCDQTPGEHPVRAFAVVKLDRHGRSEERYDVKVGAPGWHSCSCLGFLSEATERGNRGAWDSGAPVAYETFGCSHLDFVLKLLWDGLLDRPTAESAE